MTRPSAFVLSLTLAAFAMPALAADVDTPVPALQELTTEKILAYRIRKPTVNAFHVASPDTSRPAPSPLRVELATEKAYYRVGEKIKFKVKGNKDFYLYLFNHDANANTWLSLLPNSYQTNRQIKYVADKSSLVPNRGLEFYADHSGTERITMVASERYLDVEKMQRISQTKSLGGFIEWHNPLESLGAAINDSYQAELGHDKSLHVRPSRTGGLVALQTDAAPLSGLVTKEFLLTIN